ncbi:hypothetical protein KVV02_004663 [Mortierella alpina]|uniref:Zn(2)-C6 fungal-type domain-containing protein n=1 Tax=Mortierella alpina TaxID=64518 RepID=A0A9P8D1P8_MORAP|nr:hypothetical protein KVV02_004663 [Mortierella alpina]
MHPHPNYDRSQASGYAGQAAPGSTTSASALPTSTSSTSWSIGHYNSHPAQQQQQQQQQSTHYHTYPYPSHDDSRAAGGSRSIRDQSFVDTTFNSNARSMTHEGTMESITVIPQHQYHHQHHNLRPPMDATRSMPQIKVEFALPHLPGKARKRHKVATSCNRCRQNKRKCDSQVPCSNCKKNNVDCCYTDAQLSRTIWGDSPLSQEKVIGVAANRPKAQGASIRSGGTGVMMAIPPYAYGPSGVPSLFLPGNVSNDQVPHVNRTQQVLGPQSKSVSKALRVAQRGPDQYRTPLFPREPLSSSFSSSFSSSSSSYMNVTGQQPEMKPGNLATAAALTSIPHMMASASAGGQLFTVGDAMVQDIHQPQPNLTDRLFVSTLHQQPTSTGSSPHGLQRQHHHQPSQGQYGHHSAGSHGGDLSMQVSHDDRRVQQASGTHSSQRAYVSSHDSFSTSHSAHEGISFPSNNQQHNEPITYSPPPFISPADGSPTVSSPSHSNPGAPTDLATMGNVSQPTHTTAYTGLLSTTSGLFTSATSTPPLANTKTQQEQLQEQSQHHQRQARGSQQESHANTHFNTALHQYSSSTGGHPDIYRTESMSITNPVSGDIDAISVNPFTPLDEPWSSSTHLDGSNQHATLYSASSPGPSLNVKTAATGSDQHRAEVNKAKQERELRQLQKIAGDVLAIKKFDLSILMPRHISQEQDEFFITSTLTATSISGIPNHLLLLPRDANYLADVFFDHAYFYYPIINRATVELCLMEPQTPHALFVLNIVFMIACRHLARTSDMKRAIQFRERAREVQLHIDSKLRHTRLQGLLLGYLAVYGTFNPVIGLAQGCGTYNVLATTPSSPVEHPSSPRSPTSCDVFSELQAECRSVHANRGAIHEAAYQARLWTFWGFFIRDSVARLYFGWPHGLDRMFISAELPKIEGFVGVGGKRSPLSVPMCDPMAAVTGKRRGSTIQRDNAQSDKRQMTTNAERDGSEDVDRATYRNTIPANSDDEDEDEGEGVASTLNVSGKTEALQVIDEDDDPADQDRDEQGRLRLLFGMDGSPKSAKDDIRSFSVLSPKILGEQSKGHHQLPAQAMDPVEMSLHMERMKLLLDSEEDSTDGGSYCRVLFLEEVRLWILGRRVALYLAGRSSNNATMSASACPTTAKDVGAAAAREGPDTTSSLGQKGANNASLGALANRLSTGPHNGAGVWSEQAWLQDQELQTLQADLIAWDKALPEHLKFRPDVDSEDVNHKTNGKMGTLTMSYYTITIMLQSSYLPIPQFLASRRTGSRGASTPSNSSDRNTAQAENDSTPKTSSTPASTARSPSLRSVSTATSTPVVTAAPSPATNPSSEADLSFSGAPKTPHGQLSNVLLHHVELMLDSYPNWCTVAAKVNHAITAALRVSCLNARLSSSSGPAREEARAGFKMGTDLYKRLAHLPGPLTIRDWPVEEDIQLMMDIEEEFREMMMTQEEQDQSLFSSVSGDGEAEAATTATAEAEVRQCVNPPPTTTSSEGPCEASDGRRSPQHLFGLGEEEEFKFEFHHDPLL